MASVNTCVHNVSKEASIIEKFIANERGIQQRVNNTNYFQWPQEEENCKQMKPSV